MDSFIMKATRRSVTGKQVRALRRQGLLPAVIYGQHAAPVNISLDAHKATLMLQKLSSSAIVTVDVEGELFTTLVRERQRNPIKNSLVHVDFMTVSMTEKLHTMVSIQIYGESPVIEDQSAFLVTSISQVEVEALPGDLPQHLMLDISKLTEVGGVLLVSDLEVPAGVEILTAAEDVLVVANSATQPEEEEEVEAGATEPEVIERGKKDEDDE